jgi:hypothetical protein
MMFAPAQRIPYGSLTDKGLHHVAGIAFRFTPINAKIKTSCHTPAIILHSPYMAKKKPKTKSADRHGSGKLKIGDAWSAISIIAFSQNNPLKAIAEFVENSIDARAKHITIVRGKERGEHYLKIIDDGTGVPLNDEGVPDYTYVATHICDSVKKRFKREGMKGIQGEFGIGLLSFWTVGERLAMSSAGRDDIVYQMEMEKEKPGYTIRARRALLANPGTELVIHPLLPGIRQLSGEKIQNYLASELRDRIRTSGVKISIKDRFSRKEYAVEPRQFAGRLLHALPPAASAHGEIYAEIYLHSFHPENTVGLYRLGTRVLPSITSLDHFQRPPWNSGFLQGMLDVPFLTITPGTRDGIIRDAAYEAFLSGLADLEAELIAVVEREKQAEEEKASQDILKSVQRALKEAFLSLPREEYGWLEIPGAGKKPGPGKGNATPGGEPDAAGDAEAGIAEEPGPSELLPNNDRKFFEYAGPLYSVKVSPASSVLAVGASRNLRAVCRDKSRRLVENDVDILWSIREGGGALSSAAGEMTAFTAPEEPGITILTVTARQGDYECSAESVITVTAELVKKDERSDASKKGLPSYTFKHAAGELWRSRYDLERNIIVINNGHADYLYAAHKPGRKLKYICKLYAKELVLHNFPGFSREELLERMVELSLYTEENLK